MPPLSSTVTLGSISFGFFCRAKMVSTTLALRTTSYLSLETEYMPWQSALDNLQYFFLMLDRTDVYPPMQVHLFSSSSPCQTPLPSFTPDSTSEGLHTEAGHSSFSALQEHHIRLDGCSREAHGPVSTGGTQHPHAHRGPSDGPGVDHMCSLPVAPERGRSFSYFCPFLEARWGGGRDLDSCQDQ